MQPLTPVAYHHINIARGGEPGDEATNMPYPYVLDVYVHVQVHVVLQCVILVSVLFFL